MDPRLQEVADALRRGDKIDAIRLLREATGMGLKEAKETVERLIAEGEGAPPVDAKFATYFDRQRETASEGEGAGSGAAGASSGDAGSGTADAEARRRAENAALASEMQRDLTALRAPRNPDTPPLESPLAEEVEALVRAQKYIDAVKLVRERNGGGLKEAKDQVDLLMEQRGMKKPASKGCVIVVAIAVVLVGAIMALVIMG